MPISAHQLSSRLSPIPRPIATTRSACRFRSSPACARAPGQPDFATLELEYVPDRLCVELKSLKLYIWSFRDRGTFHEAVTNEIVDHLARRDAAALPAPDRALQRPRRHLHDGVAERRQPAGSRPRRWHCPKPPPAARSSQPPGKGLLAAVSRSALYSLRSRRYNRAFFKRPASVSRSERCRPRSPHPRPQRARRRRQAGPRRREASTVRLPPAASPWRPAPRSPRAKRRRQGRRTERPATEAAAERARGRAASRSARSRVTQRPAAHAAHARSAGTAPRAALVALPRPTTATVAEPSSLLAGPRNVQALRRQARRAVHEQGAARALPADPASAGSAISWKKSIAPSLT